MNDDLLLAEGQDPDVITTQAWRASSMGWTPDHILRWHLVPGEEIIYSDNPSVEAFLVENAAVVPILIGASLAFVFFALIQKSLFGAGLSLIAAGLIILYVMVEGVRQRYTIYVLTNNRILRLSGVVRLQAAWMPWAKVTDVRIERSLKGRLFGYATVFIDSANEKSGLGAMKNLKDPKAFYLKLTAMVQFKQGNEQATSIIDWNHLAEPSGRRRSLAVDAD